ncbi:hypothetical protein V2G26_017484 [Clonostachys chloroleuca]
MNPAPGQQNTQGQPQGQAQGQPQPGTAAPQPQAVVYQPSQIRQLPHLSEEEKTKYVAGLENLWAKVKNSPQGSPEYKQATEKIFSFSKMLTGKIQQRRQQIGHQQRLQQQQQLQGQQAQQGQQQPAQGQAQGQAQAVQQQGQGQGQPQQRPAVPQQAQQAQPQTQGVQGQTNLAQAQTAGQVGQPQTPAQNATAQKPGAFPNGGVQNQATPGTPTVAQAQNPQAQGQAQAQAPTPKLPENIAAHLRQVSFRPPANLLGKGSTAEATRWIQEQKTRYGRALLTMENTKTRVRAIERQVAQRQASQNPFTEDEIKKLNEQKANQLKVYNEATKWVEQFKKVHIVTDARAGTPAQAAQGAQGQKPTDINTAQNVTQSVNAAVEAAKNQQQLAGAANRQSPASTPTTNAQAQPNRPAQNPPQATSQQTQQQPQPPQPPQAHPQPQAQVQVKTEPVQPPPVNTVMAAQQAQTQGTQRVQTPQSATPVPPPGPTRALSHSAAMNLANQRAVSGNIPTHGQQQQQAQQGQTPQQVGTPTSTNGAMNQNMAAQQQQQQAAPQHQQQQGHHAHPTTQQATIQSKMPIPKQLPEKATAVPHGVAIGGGVKAGRPTMSQGSGTLGGVMNQPAMGRVPAYNNEAEGDHVLSKKKLDELVRQVCGGSSEGQEGNLLTPDVEENVLNMADSFVDNVLHAACRNAKERGSKVLEIRDIQLVLERTYNIRVPGYSSDELRTVRKVQPSPGWIAKMSAVQAAKVMPGKGE